MERVGDQILQHLKQKFTSTLSWPGATASKYFALPIVATLLVATSYHPIAPQRAAAQAPPVLGVGVENHIRHVHDPAIIRDGDSFYLFSTGPGVMMRRSRDLRQWDFVGQVFADKVPAWAKAEIPNADALWAPDISFFNGKFHLYYSVSSFGSNRSIIGLATNQTLDPQAPNYKWVDEGKVIESVRESNFNAIDPNVVQSDDKFALSFGSFWSGLKMVTLDAKTGKPAPNAPITPLASVPGTAIEAPFIIQRAGRFYLFASYDACCRGAQSTYNTRVGRAEKVEGPYLDRAGKSMLEGGGTMILESKAPVFGPGHCAVLQDITGDLLVHHFYDGDANGVPTLQIRPLKWSSDGWPSAGEPLAMNP